MRLNSAAKMIVLMMTGSLSVIAQQTGPIQIPLSTASEVKAFGRLPLTFEPNHGQVSAQVKFLSRGKGYSAFLTSGGMILNLRTSYIDPAANSSKSTQPHASRSTMLQLTLLGANPNPQIVGEDQQPGRVNYFFGQDPSKWIVKLPTYAKVRYKNVYPGIDLLYYGSNQELEYDFSVAPGADPRQIQFEIKGASKIAVDEQGDLVLGTNSGNLRFQCPAVYQELKGKRVPVAGRYASPDSTHIGFQIENYDSTKSLIIDPVLIYSTYVGGSGTDQPTGIAIDPSGNVYVAGYSDSANFPLAVLGSLSTNTYHVFVTKLDPTGSNLIFADYIGGNNDDYGMGLVIDSSNEVYVTGATQSSNFPVVNAYQAQQPGPFTGFLTKVSADGASLLYSTYLGGSTYDQPDAIAIDGSSEVLVAGYTQSLNFPVVNALQATAMANQGGHYGTYGFLTKFSATGSSLVYSTYFAGNTNVEEGGCCWNSPYSAINAIAADANGDAYVAGATNTYNFPVTEGSFLTSNTTSQNANVGFVSKFNAAGDLDYSSYFLDSSGYPVFIAAIAVDDSGSAYITGSAYSDSTFPLTSKSICDPGVYGLACSYAFVTKFNPTGSALAYSTFLGPDNYAAPQAIAIDANNDAYVLASASSSLFAEVNGIEVYDNLDDVLLVEIDPLGSTQVFATYIGGAGDDEPAGIAVDADGNMYVSGSTDSPDFPTTLGAFQTAPGGNADAFVAKIGPASAPAVSVSPSSLQFPATALNSISQPQTVLLRNMGSAALAISSIAATGDFGQTNDCGAIVSAAMSCTIVVTFRPSAEGARVGSIVIEDDAAGSPHTIPLSGVGQGGSNGNPAPIAVLTPSSLTFASVPVGRSSLPQTVTLTNAGNASLTISNFQVTGDFNENNTCSGSLMPGAACSVNIIFTPTAEGSRSGSLIVSDNAQGTPQTVGLVGIGTGGSLVLGSTNLTFPSVQLGSNASQTVTVTNTGNGPASINSLQITGDYSQVTNCPSPIGGGASCTISVVFTPTATGTLTGTLTLTSGVQGAQQIVTLSGTGVQAELSVSSTALSFSNTPLGSSSASQSLELKNSGTASLTVSDLQIGGDYKQTNNCSVQLSPGAACTVNIVFTPTAAGTRSGSLTIADSAGAPQAVSLSGTGVDFSLSSSTIDGAIQPGGTATYTLTAAAIGGAFSDPVLLSCSGLPADATCTFSRTSVTPNSTQASTTLTISTTSSISENSSTVPAGQKPINGLWMQAQGLGLVGMVLARGKKRSNKAGVWILLVLLILGMLFMTGCAGGTGIAPLGPESYTIIVRGTAGSLQHSVPVTLTVQ